MAGRLKIEIKRRPPPPPLDGFTCSVCRSNVALDPYSPDFQKPPVCHRCIFSGPRFNGIWTTTRPEMFIDFYRANVLVRAIEKECIHARRAN